MLNVGFAELLLIAVLALIFIGPKQLPEIARGLARLINQLRRTSNEFTYDFRKSLAEEQAKAAPKPEVQKVEATMPPQPPS